MAGDINLSAYTQNSKFFLNSLTNVIYHFMKLFGNYITFRDLHLKPSNTTLKHFLGSNGFYNLIKGLYLLCFNSKGSMINLVLTNRKVYLKNTQSFETGLSDHHYIVYTMLKITFQKSEHKQLTYKDVKNSYFGTFKNDLLENIVNCDRSFDEFDKKLTTVLNKHSPKKKKVASW